MKKENIKLMKPKIDFVFKSIFGNEKHPKILISFLNAVFGYATEDKKIVKVEIENPNINKEDIEDKYSILDVKATVNDDTKINIEIQIKNNYNMIPRTLYYLSKLIETQMKEGDNYDKLLKSVTINILDYKLLKNNDKIHNTFLFKEKETGELLTDLAEIHFLELPKLKDIDVNIENSLEDWLQFIENPESELVDMLVKRIPEINEAKNILKVLSLDKQARLVYEMRQKTLKDKTSALESAEEKGEKREKIKIAKKMLGIGLDLKIILETTELSKEEIEKLKKEL